MIMTKEEILKHIDDLSAQQLYEAICEGVVTMKDLTESDAGLGKSKREEIKALLNSDDADWTAATQSGTESAFRDYQAKHPKGKHVNEVDATIAELQKGAVGKADEEAWGNVNSNNLNSLNAYLQQYPNGLHVEEARKAISVINQTRQSVLNGIKNLHPTLLLSKITSGVLSWDDLNGRIDSKIIKFLKENANSNMNGVKLQLPGNQDPVKEGHTEVYFWGVPGSGKTCALGSVLATANAKGYLTKVVPGSGFNYANQLKNIFKANDVSILPPPTSEDSTQYLPIELTNPKTGKIISVSILEVAGEVFKDYYRLNDDPSKVSGNHPQLQGLLASPNKKIHFFFVDFSLNDREDNEGLKQSDYLQAAATYFEKSEIFSKNTDAIYLVVTKSDMMDCDNVKTYLTGPVCASLTTALKNQCIKNHINQQNLIGLKFSIGEVSMGGKLCIHNSQTSENILDILFRKVSEN